MFACKSCGAAIHFDIASQQMLCPYCNNKYDPYSIEEQGNASERQEFETTVFTCTQCGGRLGSVENSAAEFCSFCGAPTVLESRLSRMKRPKYIIPFKKTREESKALLKKSLGSAWFVPKDFKDARVEKMRGIYMPYWSYNITQTGKATFKFYMESSVNPDTIIDYEITAPIEARYNGIPHDASEAFADRLSELIEPFNHKDRKPFVPAFLAGFYSDMPDVTAGRYGKEAMEIANINSRREFIKQMALPESAVTPKDGDQLALALSAHREKPDNTLAPIWFMSYRKGDRIAYATVNGETGKVVTDMPVSIGKLWLFAVLFAIPIFLFLNMIVSMHATTALVCADIALTVACLLYIKAVDEKIERESKDLEFLKAEKQADSKLKVKVKKVRKPLKKGFVVKVLAGMGCAAVLIIPIMAILYLVGAIAIIGGALAIAIILLILIIGSAGLSIYGIIRYFDSEKIFNANTVPFIVTLATAITSFAIFIIDPVSDVVYYAGVIACLVSILFTLSCVIRDLNILTTRPLPHFESRGGERFEV